MLLRIKFKPKNKANLVLYLVNLNLATPLFMGGVSFYNKFMENNMLFILVLIYLMGSWLGRRISHNLYYNHVSNTKKASIVFFSTILSWISVFIFLIGFYIATKQPRD